MKTRGILLFLTGACVMLALQATAFAVPVTQATSTCLFTFTSGNNNTYLKYCVTANGNIVQFESPQGHEHIQVFDVTEGYGICDFTDADNNISYFDYAGQGDSGNWGPASVVSQTVKSIKIARTTSDGMWTLTQTISQIVGAPPSAQITMAFKNNTVDVRDVALLRSADVDADGLISNNLDATINSAFGWNSSSSGHGYGLVLQDAGTTQALLSSGLAVPTPNSPDPCRLEASPGPFTNTDGTIVMEYGLEIPGNSSKTVKVAYRGF